MTRRAVGACRTRFGAFSAACGAAGLEIHTKKEWTRGAVLRGLRRLALDGPVQRRRAVGGLDHACVRFFGSFAAARAAALSGRG